MNVGKLKLEVNNRHLFAIVLMLFIQSAYCQSFDNNGKRYVETKNLGSAKDINGSTYILSIFASEGDDKWTIEEKKRFMKKEQEAYDWLSKEVKTYNKTFSYKRGVFYRDEEDFKLTKQIKINTIDSIKYVRENVIAMLLEALQSKGSKSPKSFYDFITAKFNCNNLFVNFYIKGKGQSFCLPYLKSSDSSRFLEVNVLCEINKLDNEISASSIAHETLHIFGAWDLYAVISAGKEKAEMAKKKFVNSIMLNTRPSINFHTLDEVTAWRIGLANIKEWYYDFVPVHFYY
jgi:hypothetical protein